MNDDPRMFHISNDHNGFYIADDDGDDIEPTWRWTNLADANAALDAMVQDFLGELFAEYDREVSE